MTIHTVGVSLMLRGEVLPSDSFVDIDDIMYTAYRRGPTDIPSNRNPRSSEALTCVTDLVDCCGTESNTTTRTVHGDWYLPDGNRVGFDEMGSRAFQANRGPNEVINGSQVYGSVRLYRRYTPPQRGRFRCELPSATDPSVNQMFYAIICEFITQLSLGYDIVHYTCSHCFLYTVNFGFRHDLEHVTISPSTGYATAGETYSLTCSSTLFEPSRLPSDLPLPNFQWSFNGSTLLPSGVTAMPTVMSSSNSTSETYTSILPFSPLSQSHTGMYMCQLGAGILVNSAMITVDGMIREVAARTYIIFMHTQDS